MLAMTSLVTERGGVWLLKLFECFLVLWYPVFELKI